MKNNINTILIVVAALCSSCSDFLKEVSQDEFEPKTVSSFQELMNGMGYTLSATDPITYLIDDDCDGCKSSYWVSEHTSIKELFCWQPDYWKQMEQNSNVVQRTLQSYKSLYSTISALNIIIERTPDAQGTQQEKDILMAEAKTMRAFYYLQLVLTYALPYNDKVVPPTEALGVPLVTKSEVLDGGVARATVAEVYDQIAADIEDACRLVDTDKNGNHGKYRTSYAATHLLASRVYLYMEQWDKVIEHSTLAMEAAPALANLTSYALDNQLNPTNGVISTKFPETIFIVGFRANSGSYGLMGTPFGVSTAFGKTFSIMDSRMNVYIAPSGYDYPYRIHKICADEHEKVWRTAELYLNRAEAYLNLYAQGNSEAGSLWAADMEALMSKRYIRHNTPEAGNIDEMTALMRSERRKELCFEGFRFFDLKRYGMPSFEHHVVTEGGGIETYVLNERDPFYCLPFPDEALDHNPLLIQNPLPERRQQQ